MKNQYKKCWVIGGMTVILIVACSFLGNAQTPNTPTYGTNIVDKTVNQKKDSIDQNKNINANENNLIIDRYERMPTFPGGSKELFKFISKNLRYPIEDIEKGIEGRVIVRFIVRKTGKIENAKVVRSVSKSIDEEALRIVNSLPDFIPGEQGGKKVDIEYTLPVPFKISSNTKNNVYTVVDKMPQFPGGDSELFSFINSHIHYPVAGLDEFPVGKVILRFIITKKGSVTGVEILRSLDPFCDREAVRVIKMLPNFIPGEHKGKKVAVYYTLPVTFKME
ncbi:MAG: energy transducer TonB [Paludibacter sp.]|nr:energy transducer TonB [Paludibacter sp.]